MRKAADACVSVLHGQTDNPLARGLFERYFQQFYHSVNLDEKGIAAMLKIATAKPWLCNSDPQPMPSS